MGDVASQSKTVGYFERETIFKNEHLQIFQFLISKDVETLDLLAVSRIVTLYHYKGHHDQF